MVKVCAIIQSLYQVGFKFKIHLIIFLTVNYHSLVFQKILVGYRSLAGKICQKYFCFVAKPFFIKTPPILKFHNLNLGQFHSPAFLLSGYRLPFYNCWQFFLQCKIVRRPQFSDPSNLFLALQGDSYVITNMRAEWLVKNEEAVPC